MSDHPLDDWVRATAPRAVAYARSLLANSHDAEEIVQDCYGRLLAKAEVYDLPRDGLKLLLTAISNACMNARSRRKHWLSLSRGPDEVADDPADDASPTPDQIAEGLEMADAIKMALDKLPTLQRAAIQLKSLGHSQQEISEILSITSNNAGVLIHRARKSLADELAPYLGGEAVR